MRVVVLRVKEHVTAQRQPCPHCGALLFVPEIGHAFICCRNGQTELLPRRDPARGTAARWIHDRMRANDADGKLFRKYARTLNSNLALASQRLVN